MNRLSMFFALAALLACVAAANDVQAQSVYGQSYDHGYGFGLGFGNNHGHARDFGRTHSPFFMGNFGFIDRVEEPPYFAKFPPVYYSYMVPRPYGISPYAAPPGIMPAEVMAPQVQHEVIKNPYIDQTPQPIPAAPDMPLPDPTPAPLIPEQPKDK